MVRVKRRFCRVCAFAPHIHRSRGSPRAPKATWLPMLLPAPVRAKSPRAAGSHAPRPRRKNGRRVGRFIPSGGMTAGSAGRACAGTPCNTACRPCFAFRLPCGTAGTGGRSRQGRPGCARALNIPRMRTFPYHAMQVQHKRRPAAGRPSARVGRPGSLRHTSPCSPHGLRMPRISCA